MSATAAATRQAAQSGGRQGWLASLRDEALSFVKGDNNAPWAILAETVVGCVPVLGQIVDARDIIKGLIEVSGAPASPLAWFNLITALIGVIPGGGDAAKRSLRAVKSGAANVDDLLAMIRRIYNGDPEKLLRKVLDVSALRKQLDTILDNPNLLRRLSPEARQSVDTIQRNLGKQFDAFKKEVDGWLAKGRKTSAQTPPAAKHAPGTPPAKPKTQAQAGTSAKGQHHNPTARNTANGAIKRSERFKTLSNKVLGILGEHMADYHCQEVKGWGTKAPHDKGQKNPAKLNDASHLVQLWPIQIRGRGIDAVWKTKGRKPYAVIEAKASYDPTKKLRTLLGEAGDKTERDGSESGSSKKKGRSKKSAAVSAGGTPATRQTNGKVTQMSHGWIEKRIPQALKTAPADLAVFRRKKRDAYTRHVLFFSIPHAVSHAEALILHTAGKSVDASMHATHQVTREWTDSDIEKVVDNRAGFAGPARDKRTR
jgi:hypothetical protein